MVSFVPVDGDPFAQMPQASAQPRLVPVEGNPFDQHAAAPAPDADFDANRSVTQTATGFNEGFASSILRPLDVVPYFVSKAMGGEGVHPLERAFREHFVDPMGEPQNRVEQTLRAGGRMAGENLPLM